MPGDISSPLCCDHKHLECIYWCKPCKKSVCTECTISSHSGHRFTTLEAILHEKRASLQQELENLELNSLKGWQGLLLEARRVTTDFLDQVNGIDKEVDKRAEEFHKKVDAIRENNKKQLTEIKTSYMSVLQEQEKKIADGLEKVKQEIKICEDQLRNCDMQSLLEFEGVEHNRKHNLPKISYVIPFFTPSLIDTKSLTEMFGELTMSKSSLGADSKSKDQPSPVNSLWKEFVKKLTVKHTSEATGPGYKKPAYTSQDGPKESSTASAQTKQLLFKPYIKSKFDTGYCDPVFCTPSLTCVGSGHAWVKTDRRKLKLMDTNGHVKETIDINSRWSNVVKSAHGDIILTDESDKNNICINSISSDRRIKTLFRIESGIPSGLCLLNSGDIAITFYSNGKVFIYSMSGKVIKELDKKKFINPHRVAQNKVNNDIYIAYKTCYRNTYDSGGKVLALGKDYNVRYEYTGQENNTKPLYPSDLCTDDTGHVLILDGNGDQVHILDKDGRFLQYLLTGDHGLWGLFSIDVDGKGNAWVSVSTVLRSTSRVQIVKYMQ